MPAAALDLVVWILLLGPGGASAAGLAAVAAAAAWHLRIESLLFVPIWLWVAGRREPGGWRGSRAATFAVVYVALCLPWFIASQRTNTGFSIHPMLLYTAEYPGYTSSRTLGAHLPGALEFVAGHLGEFGFRFFKDGAGYVIDILDGLGPIALAAAFAGVALGRMAVRRYTPLIAAIGLQVFAMSALERNPLFLIPVVPLLLVLVGIAASPALERISHRRALAALLVAVALERGARVLVQRADARRRFPPVAEGTAGILNQRARGWPDGLILSDAPDWIAWHLDRPALLLPMSAQLDSLVTARAPAAIWLSPVARDRNVADRDSGWVRVIDEGGRLEGFRGPDRLPGGSTLYVLGSRIQASTGESHEDPH
jgi:hypothetical protein